MAQDAAKPGRLATGTFHDARGRPGGQPFKTSQDKGAPMMSMPLRAQASVSAVMASGVGAS